MNRRQFFQRSTVLSAGTGLGVMGLSGGNALHAKPDEPSFEPTLGPLKVHPKNGRYFIDSAGRAVCLSGSHLGWELQDHSWDKPIVFDFPAYLDLMNRHRHNLLRLWSVEHTRSSNPKVKTAAKPMPYLRSGPGQALDGLPKFDLSKFDPNYFHRLQSRVEAAQKRGIYVMVMLFQGWSLRSNNEHLPWFGHYLNPRNNINDIAVDDRGMGKSVHSLANQQITTLQEAYVRKVIETLNNQDNVLYEIANESLGSQSWHEHMVDFIHRSQRTRKNQHPVVVSGCRRGLNNTKLRSSRAEAIGITRDGRSDFFSNPPTADGSHVVLADSDHIKPSTHDPSFVWRNFLRGNHPLVLDWGLTKLDDKTWLPIRQAMGRVQTLCRKIDLASMTPQNNLATTRFCLATAGFEYLVYLPRGGKTSVDLSAGDHLYQVTWHHPVLQQSIDGGTVRGSALQQFTSPFPHGSVLHLSRIKS